MALLLADLGVTKTHSRPHVSDDNPFSEAHFKTLKYRPGMPELPPTFWTGLLRYLCCSHQLLHLIGRGVVESGVQSVSIVEALDVLEPLVLDVVNVNGRAIEKLGFCAAERRFRDWRSQQLPRRLMLWIMPSCCSRDRYAAAL